MNRSRQSGRWLIRVAGVLAILLSSTSTLADDNETLQRAIDTALQGLVQDLGQKTFEQIKSVAVVPLRGDEDGYATGRVRDAVTRTEYGLFTRNDETWDTLLAEIEWGVRREDVMNPDTVQKFGKVEGVDAIIYGRIWDRGVNLWSIRGHAKVSLVLADVETGQELWRSGPLAGEAFIHWSGALMQFWRYPLLLLVALFVLIVLAIVIRKHKKAYKPL